MFPVMWGRVAEPAEKKGALAKTNQGLPPYQWQILSDPDLQQAGMSPGQTCRSEDKMNTCKLLVDTWRGVGGVVFVG